jgi:hypothetical protein
VPPLCDPPPPPPSPISLPLLSLWGFGGNLSLSFYLKPHRLIAYRLINTHTTLEQLGTWCGSASGKSAGPGNTIVDFKRVREKKGKEMDKRLTRVSSPTIPFSYLLFTVPVFKVRLLFVDNINVHFPLCFHAACGLVCSLAPFPLQAAAVRVLVVRLPTL